MTTNNNQVNESMKASSKMAGELEEIFNECKKLKDSDILVPQDVRQRLKEICRDCEKIIKDMPNKKFSLAIHVHSGKKAQSYLDKLNEKVKKFNSNRTSFIYLSNFYGNVSEYDKKMLKHNDKFVSIVSDVKKLIEKNSKLLENKKLIEDKAFEPCKEDKELVGLGCFKLGKSVTTNTKRLDYKCYVKSYFQELINCKVSGGTLPEVFRKVSYSLGRIKNVVDVNENDKAVGIQTIRASIITDMKNIILTFNRYTKTAEEGIAFLQSLPIEDSSMAKTREQNIRDLNGLLGKYEENLRKMDKVKSNVLYGETKTDKRGYGQKNILFANSMRVICKKFISGIRKVLSDVKGGEAVSIVSDDVKNLNNNFDIFAGTTVSNFIENANHFEGYFKNLTDKDRKLLDDKKVAYDTIQGELWSMQGKLRRVDDTKEMNKIKDKLEEELIEYNKTSSKIKRGFKRVLGVAKTMAKYVTYVSTFINTVTGLSNNCNALLALFKSSEEEKTVEVPLMV